MAKDLLKTLQEHPVLCAEGYLFELERRGYLQAGSFVPAILLENPEAVKTLHTEFAMAGSDVMEALTYYAHKEKLRIVGLEDKFEEMNQTALSIAKDVANDYDLFFAGNICNTNIFDTKNQAIQKEIISIFEQQVGWANDAGVDYIIGETFSYLGEALLATDVIKKAGQTAVITMAIDRDALTRDGFDMTETAKRLVDAGADVVGLNCFRGPEMIRPLTLDMRDAVDVPIACLPVPYRTTPDSPNFMTLHDPYCPCHLPHKTSFPTALDPFQCNRYEVADFAKDMVAEGIHYIGLCCGAGPHHIRAVAEALGRTPKASKYTEDMSKHAYFGADPKLRKAKSDRKIEL